jgi:hypothetical protein
MTHDLPYSKIYSPIHTLFLVFLYEDIWNTGLSVHFDTHVGTDDPAEGAAVTFLFILKHAVVIS